MSSPQIIFRKSATEKPSETALVCIHSARDLISTNRSPSVGCSCELFVAIVSLLNYPLNVLMLSCRILAAYHAVCRWLRAPCPPTINFWSPFTGLKPRYYYHVLRKPIFPNQVFPFILGRCLYPLIGFFSSTPTIPRPHPLLNAGFTFIVIRCHCLPPLLVPACG